MELSQQTFSVDFLLPKQFLDREDWQEILWDETLRLAHAKNVIPVGPIMFTTEEMPPSAPTSGPLIPGVPMEAMPLVRAGLIRVDMVKIHASVMLGAALD